MTRVAGTPGHTILRMQVPAARFSGAAVPRLLVVLFKVRVGALVTFTAVAGAVVATRGTVSVRELAALIAAVGLTTAGAGCLNHFLDRDIDAAMERTRSRPLPAGHIRRLWTVPVAGVGLVAAGVAAAARWLNLTVALYGLLGAGIYVAVYTGWLKRRTPWNIVIGGLAGSAAVLGGGAVSAAGPDLATWTLATVVFLWTPPHFWSLAIAYMEDYRRAGVPMLPVVAGPRRTGWAILASTVLLVAVTVLPVLLDHLGRFFLLAAVVAGSGLAAANIALLRDPSRREAMRNFHLSNLYLVVIFCAAIFSIWP